MFNKRFVGLFLFSLVLTSLFVGVVSAADPGVPGPIDTIFSAIGKAFESIGKVFGITSTTTGTSFLQSDTFARFLMFCLVALVIYSVSPFLPFVSDKSWATIGISLIVAALSTFFLKKEEVYTAILSYNALGVTLTAIIPFFAIAAIALKARTNGHVLLSKSMWVAFMVVIIMRLSSAATSGQDIGDFGRSVYWITLLGALFMFLFDKYAAKLFLKWKMRGSVDATNLSYQSSMAGALARKEQALEALIESGQGGIKFEAANQLRREIKELKAQIARPA